MQGLKAFSLGIMGESCRTTERLSNLEFLIFLNGLGFGFDYTHEGLMDLGLYKSGSEKDTIHDLVFGNETGVRKMEMRGI